MSKGKILFIVGSPNQTSQMHQIAEQLPEYDCFFSQIFSTNPLIKAFVKTGWLDSTILSGGFKQKADEYLSRHNLPNDYATMVFNNKYDLAVLCSDLLVTKSLRQFKTVFVQEGMTDPITPWGKVSRCLGLPAYMAMNTSFNGGSNICDIYCAASDGYKEQFAALGTEADRIFVTGIPNYDNVRSFLQNDFPHHDYVLAATSDIRETFRKDDREKFIGRCAGIANGRQLIFKLHPNEIKERAIAEIQKWAPPGTLIFSDGNTNHMVANCEELITQYSTVVYTGIALGKKVHSYFDVSKLRQLTPVQNGGRAALNIAEICRNYLEFQGTKEQFTERYSPSNLMYA